MYVSTESVREPMGELHDTVTVAFLVSRSGVEPPGSISSAVSRKMFCNTAVRVNTPSSCPGEEAVNIQEFDVGTIYCVVLTVIGAIFVVQLSSRMACSASMPSLRYSTARYSNFFAEN